MKWLRYVIPVVLLFGLAIFFLKPGRAPQPKPAKKNVTKLQKPGKVRFKFVELPKGIVARAGEFDISKIDWRNKLSQDPVFKDLAVRKYEIATALAYQQLIQSKDPMPKSMSVTSPVQLRSNKGVLANYGVQVDESIDINITEVPGKKYSFVIDGKKYGVKDLETAKSILWGDIESKIFRLKLKYIDEEFYNKYLMKAVKDTGLNTKEVFEKNGIEVEPPTRKSRELSEEERKKFLVEKKLFKSRKKAFIEKEHGVFPIEVDIRRPVFKYDVRLDWTPSLGPEDSPVKVIVVGDFWTESSKKITKNLEKLSQEFPNVYFGWRPYFTAEKRFQRMLSEFSFCMWMGDRDSFWKTIGATSEVTRDNFGKDLDNVIETLDNSEKIKKCFYEQKHKEVVDYHQNYGQFLNLYSTPAVFVGGEVFLGAPSLDQIYEAISRALNEPSAGDLKEWLYK